MSDSLVNVNVERQEGGVVVAADRVDQLTVVGRPRDLLLESGAWDRKGDHPSALLRAAHQVVPFDEVGRAAELSALKGWMHSDRRDDVWLWTGPGGAGKTRLAIELVRRAREDGWKAGFLPAGWSVGADLLIEGRHLIVIDYAETRGDQLRALLGALVCREGGPAVRVLLLARRVADWWVHGLRREPGAKALIEDGPAPRELAPLADSPARREALFEAAAAAFRPRLGRAVEGPRPALGGRLFERALYNLIAAYAWLLGHKVEDEQGALDFALDHEIAAWVREPMGRLGPSLERSLREILLRGAAGLTLVGGVEEGAFDGLLSATSPAPRLGVDLRTEGYGLREFYSRTGGLDPVEPDLLGEQLVGRALGLLGPQASGWIEAVLAASPDAALDRCWQVLGRLAERDARARGWILGMLEGRLPERAERAVAAAAQLGRESHSVHTPLGQIVAVALEELPGDEAGVALAERLHESIERPTLGLREVGAVTAGKVLGARRAEGLEEEQARWANDLGVWRSELGDREGAVEATREAVEIRRRLAAVRPDAFLPKLAGSLTNLGSDLSAFGDRKGALAATREAVEHHRRLSSVRPDAFLPDLAMSLNNLGSRLSALGDHEGALEANREAVEHRRRLASVRPETFLPDLAMSLNNLGVTLSARGHREWALEAVREAVGHYRCLAVARPDAFLPDLAMSLNNLGAMLAANDDRERALASILEAVEHYRRLASVRPDAFLPDLARALGSRGLALGASERHGEAADAFAEGARLLLPFVRRHPAAFARLGAWLVDAHVTAATTANLPPDAALITAYAAFRSQT